DARPALCRGRADHLRGDGHGSVGRARGSAHACYEPARGGVRLAGRLRLVLRGAGLSALLVRPARPRAPGLVRGVPLRHLCRPPAAPLHRPRVGAGARRSATGRYALSQGGVMDRVIIFDTTLRDGEQAPGFSMNTMEKLEMARQLARLNVDVIEAGFPISSEEDFEATRAVEYARTPRIHTFVATSDIHLMYKLRKSRAEIMKAAVDAVRHARGYCQDVEFSPEDASRTDFDYMCDVLSAVIDAGARTINIPDTVGYAIPRDWGERIARIREKVQG